MNKFKKIVWPMASKYYFLLSKIQISQLVKSRDSIFLEVGAGKRPGKNGWITMDMNRKCDLFWDLRNGIPFPDASIDKLYSSHFLEHLSYQEQQVFLDECLRVMKPGSLFSICLPNARLFIDAYRDDQHLDVDKLFTNPVALYHNGKIDYINYVAYMNGNHKYMFDEENILQILTKKGFTDASLRDFDPMLDKEERRQNSLFAQAIRP